MKKRLAFLLALLVILSFSFKTTSPVKLTPPVPPTNPITDKFLFGAMDNYIALNNYNDNYDDMGFSLWHSYIVGEWDSTLNRHLPKGRFTSDDKLMTPVGIYAGALRNKIDEIYTHNQSSIIWQRPKIEYLCYGQSSIYEAEPVDPDTDLWFYAFNEHPVGDLVTDGGKDVMYCEVNPNQTDGGAGFVVKKLRANTEQCHRITDVKATNHWQGDSECDWLIKPRIRIPSSFPTTNGETPVCRIYVYEQDGLTLKKDVIIKAKYFLNGVGSYDGSYKEEFNFGSDPVNLTFHGDLGNLWGFVARGTLTSATNEADIQVEWLGNCDMWLDYVKVENDVADELMNPNNPLHASRLHWIEAEVDSIAMHLPTGATIPPVAKFYVEVTEFNNHPCMAYVNEKLKEYSDGKIDLMPDYTFHNGVHVPYDKRNTVSSAEFIYEHYIQQIGLTQIYAESYPLTGHYDLGPIFSKIPETLKRTSGFGILAEAETLEVYDAWLQDNINYKPYKLETNTGAFVDVIDRQNNRVCENPALDQDKGNFRYVMQTCSKVAKLADIPFIHMPQAHTWHTPGEVRREPTNEELDMMANVAISYGVRGLNYYWYPGFDEEVETCPSYSYSIGDPPGNTLREDNVYEQDYPKWQTLRDINLRVKKWESTIMSFNHDFTNSYIYNDDEERNDLLIGSYFSEVISYKTGSGYPTCIEDRPDTTLTGDALPTSGKKYECKEDRYLQVATFENSSEARTNYFMIVNRRCSPYKDESSENNRGGQRFIYVAFNEGDEELDGFNNWIIQEVGGNEHYEFHKNMYQRVNLGEFKPGEGKLYKMSPTVIAGGTLKGNEDISGQTFTCEDTVYNGGYNITIDSGSTVSFTDSASIIMTGGTFQSGVLGSSSGQLTTFKGEGSSKWSGLRFTNANVKIYNTKFQDISSPSVNYAVSMYNCPLGDIRGSQFVMSTDTSGAVQSVYATTSEEISYQGMYFNYNSVTMNSSRSPAVTCQGFSGLTMPVSVMNNSMSSSGYATGVMLTGITSAGVKKNTITGFSTGVNLLSSTADIFGNTISNTTSVSKGVTLYSASTANMAPAGYVYTGGYNVITNTYGSSINVELNSSIALLENGNNTFDINSSASPQAYHIYGTFPESSYPTQYAGNCYKLDGTAISSGDPYFYLTADGENALSTKFAGYICDAELPGVESIADLGNGVYDTIPGSEYGMGGGMSSNRNLLPLNKGETERGYLKAATVLTLSPAKLFDSINVQMSRRDYSSAKTFCYELIETYPDSFQSVSSLQTLYLCVTATDTTYTGRSGLKTFYETLILEHGYNTSLVKSCNYLAQKCKVLLGQYSSAMTGFQQIITNNPYSYEGLLAKWDYMATNLLAPGGGGMPDVVGDVRQLPDLNTNNGEEYEFDESYESGYGDDKNPFTKDEKKQIYTSVKTAFETAKNDDDRKIKTLEDNSKNGDVVSTKQLQQMQTLKQLVKTEKPHSIIEHISIVGSDMQKVFGNTSPVAVNKGNSIPIEFSLGQNYPNPFNPVTTIKYALPHDAKVVIKIYDILGREVKMLINQQQTAGYYDVKFDGSVFASGVYFYRIEAGDFVQSKKMVLVK